MNTKDIQSEVVRYFGGFFMARENVNIDNQLKFINSFQLMFLKEEVLEIDKYISLKEITIVLKDFAKNKCLGLDEWTIEVFLHFIDIMGMYLVHLAE